MYRLSCHEGLEFFCRRGFVLYFHSLTWHRPATAFPRWVSVKFGRLSQGAEVQEALFLPHKNRFLSPCHSPKTGMRKVLVPQGSRHTRRSFSKSQYFFAGHVFPKERPQDLSSIAKAPVMPGKTRPHQNTRRESGRVYLTSRRKFLSSGPDDLSPKGPGRV